ncbi:MAG: polyprenyl synthetase family protein, partial [Patescibacteria group bacterium]
MDVKKTIADFAKIIELKIEQYWDEEISRNFGFNQHQKDLVLKILNHAKEHNLRPGKRLRASLVYYGYLLGKPEDERIFKAAMAVELVHSALLIHDDFMDQDDIRRGLPTTHQFFANGDDHYGASMALNLGDIILTLGYELLLKCGFEPELVNKAAAKLLRTAINTGYGQALDISLEKIPDMDESDPIAVYKTKTALYTYENPLVIGAILAGLDQEILDILHDYAMDAGVAFQIQDDILGVFGDSQKTGKSDNSDLL